MTEVPIIELACRTLGETVRAAVMLHQEEIAGLVQQGVDHAIAHIAEDIITEAAKIATQKIHEDVKHYLLYGTGGQAIRAAVHHALEPWTLILQAASSPGTGEG